MKMKRMVLFILVVVMALCVTTMGLADGYQYQPVPAQEYYIFANGTSIYSDSHCTNYAGSLDFGTKVYLQQTYDQVSSVNVNGRLFYIENARLAQPLKKIRLTNFCYLAPNSKSEYDNHSTFSCAVGGYRKKEDALVLAEFDGHYYIVTDEGFTGWISKKANFKVIENYGTSTSSLNTYYYSMYLQSQQDYEWGYYISLRPSLKLYKSASTKSESNEQISFGAELEILEYNGEWCKVYTDGTTGWTRKAFLGSPEMKVRINGKVNLAPLPGMEDSNYASACGGIASYVDAIVIGIWGDYYQVVTSDGQMGFVYQNNPNVVFVESYGNG